MTTVTIEPQPAGDDAAVLAALAQREIAAVSAQVPLAVPSVRWTDRTFPTQLPIGFFAPLVHRFSGVALRAGLTLLSVPTESRVRRPAGDAWSIQEHAGHLLDLETLNETRLTEFEAGASELTPADMSNRATADAEWNARDPYALLDELSARRAALVQRLRAFAPGRLAHVARHPRLGEPMNVVGWLFFMCDHDDHHLSRMHELAVGEWRSLAARTDGA